ncbi:MAG TPA: DNA polymerase [Mycobacteriales bacterium]|jgi:DNA polymerase-1|nr:DNA polymerase [Mycobacteriales bacterium]
MSEARSFAGVPRGEPLAVVLVEDHGLALAWHGGSRQVPTSEPAAALRELASLEPRWTWWAARVTATALVQAGIVVRACWDLGAVGRFLHGLRRDDPAAVWAAGHDLPPPDPPRETLDLFDLAEPDAGSLASDGQLNTEWLHSRATSDLEQAQQLAELAINLQQRQRILLDQLPDPRAAPQRPALALLTAYSESAAALIAVELEQVGLPFDRDTASALLTEIIGDRPADRAAEQRQRDARDQEVRQAFATGQDVDLRSPAQVRDLLARIGIDVPDTRSWRLEPHAPALPAVAALLRWRKAERTATTYGWRWLDTNVADGRLCGSWNAADGGSGRMTATAGLHNLPADLRPAVRAEAGRLLIRADLGQVEPRVLAAVSGDDALIRATHEPDMYAPVAARLQCDRPTAKIAVLAAMYGQTSGPAGDTVRVMDRAYPQAMAYLRSNEAAGREHVDIRTYGGRLIRLSGAALDPAGEPVSPEVAAGHGRYARNCSVQGPAAELFKAWAATARDGLRDLSGEIVLCLHDELLVHVPAANAEPASELLHQALDATARWWAAGRSVRFIAEIASGVSWAAAH